MRSMPEILEGETEQAGNMPNPEDIGLDVFTRELVRSVSVSDRAGWDIEAEYGDFEKAVGPEEITERGIEIGRSMEQDKDSIESRQEVFQYMMDNDELRELILEDGIPSEDVLSKIHRGESPDNVYERRVNSVKKYTGFFQELNSHLQDTDVPEAVERYSEEIDDFMASESFEEFENILEDAEEATKTQINIDLPMDYNRFEGGWATLGSVKIASELQSGKEGSISDSSGGRETWSDFPYKSLVKDLVEKVEDQTGIKARRWKAPINIEMHVDEEDEALEASASVENKGLPQWASNLMSSDTKIETVETELDFEYSDINDSNLEHAIKKVKADALSTDIKEKYSGSLDEVGALRQAKSSIAELKYVAAAAEYMNQLEEESIPLTIPETLEDGSTSIQEMLDPNLVSTEGVEEVVANDVGFGEEKNVYMLTGPNNGGKTTYMNAIGLTHAMHQMGMPVLAEEAEMKPKDMVLTHYIQQEDIAKNESRYTNELSRIKGDVFKEVTDESLVLVDEPFSGTAPEAGAHQLDGTLKALSDLGSTNYASTHYHSVEVPGENATIPELIRERKNSQNLQAVTTGEDGISYTYEIKPGYSTVSEGRAVAEELGTDPASLREILEEREDVDFSTV